MQSSSGLTAIAGILCVCTTGCFFIDTGEDDDVADPQTQLNLDREEYIHLQRALDQERREVLGDYADELYAADDVLYWLNFSQFDPTLHSYSNGEIINYDFSIGGGNTHNFRASGKAIATAVDDGGIIRYELYAADELARSLGSASFDAPSDEQRWWAYAVDDTSLYVMTTGEVTTLHRYDANAETPVVVTTLESAGCQVGEFWAFGVEGDTAYLVESGRLWHLDIPTNQCVFMGNETQIAGAVSFNNDGVVYEASDGPFFFDNAAGVTTDVAQAIDAADYRINETYNGSHRWYQGVTRYRDWMVYVGSSGVFGYHLETREVRPILIEPIDLEVRIEYRYPVVLDDGSLYVTGLTSYSGSVGADGPVYSVPLDGIL